MTMPRLLVSGFNKPSVDIIVDALSFVKSLIKKYAQEKKLLVDEVHHHIIDSETESIIVKIENYAQLLKDTADLHFQIEERSYYELLDIIRSALEVYLQDTLQAKEKTGLSSFDTKIAEIRRLINLESLKNRKPDLFTKYYVPSFSMKEGKKVEVFLSYSHADRNLAGEVAKLLEEKGIDVFLAHEDINISEEWREEILKHLKNCTLLIALLTPNFKESVWTNQEAGFALGRGAKIIPLIVGGTDIKVFGFLESLQGIHVKEDNLPDCIEKILKIIMQ